MSASSAGCASSSSSSTSASRRAHTASSATSSTRSSKGRLRSDSAVMRCSSYALSTSVAVLRLPALASACIGSAMPAAARPPLPAPGPGAPIGPWRPRSPPGAGQAPNELLHEGVRLRGVRVGDQHLRRPRRRPPPRQRPPGSRHFQLRPSLRLSQLRPCLRPLCFRLDAAFSHALLRAKARAEPTAATCDVVQCSQRPLGVPWRASSAVTSILTCSKLMTMVRSRHSSAEEKEVVSPGSSTRRSRSGTAQRCVMACLSA